VAKLFRRLRDEHGYAGGYERVRLYMLSHHRSQREMFIPWKSLSNPYRGPLQLV
jgi:hypothetical protein